MLMVQVVDYTRQTFLSCVYMYSQEQNMGTITWRIYLKYHPLIYVDLLTWLTEFQHTSAIIGANLLWYGTVLGHFYFVCNFCFEIWKQILKRAINERFIPFSCQSNFFLSIFLLNLHNILFWKLQLCLVIPNAIADHWSAQSHPLKVPEKNTI